jgi:hypothetical protein
VAGQYVLPQQLLTPKPPSELAAGARPEFTFVPDLVVEATRPDGAIVNFAVTAEGEIGVATITYSIPSGTLFPIGTVMVVTATAIDEGGNVATTTFTVLVHDTTPPAFTLVSPDLVVISSVPVAVTYALAIATDAVGPVTITYSKASGSVFSMGVTVVTVTATDGAGNRSIRTFTVTVRPISVPPSDENQDEERGQSASDREPGIRGRLSRMVRGREVGGSSTRTTTTQA